MRPTFLSELRAERSAALLGCLALALVALGLGLGMVLTAGVMWLCLGG